MIPRGMEACELAGRVALSGVELGEDEDIEVLLDACTCTGARGIELWWPRNFASTAPGHMAARLAEKGIASVCLTSGIELYRDEGSETQQANLLALVSLARKLGIGAVSSFFGFSRIRDDERSISLYRRWLEPCLERAEAGNVTILLENEFDAFGWDPAASDVTRRPDALRRLAERIGSSHFGITFDPANYLCAGVDPLDALDTLLPHVRYVHVKDVARTAAQTPMPGWRDYRDHDRTYTTCPLGEGQAPWPALIGRLRASRFDGWVCLEPHAAPSRRDAAWRQAAGRLQEWLAALEGIPR